jgi:hypothetical protein
MDNTSANAIAFDAEAVEPQEHGNRLARNALGLAGNIGIVLGSSASTTACCSPCTPRLALGHARDRRGDHALRAVRGQAGLLQPESVLGAGRLGQCASRAYQARIRPDALIRTRYLRQACRPRWPLPGPR